MKQLRLAVKETYKDWVYAELERLGVDPRNDPNRDNTIDCLAAESPHEFYDADAARVTWFKERIKDILKEDGIRAVHPLTQAGASAGQGNKIKGAQWQQLTLPGYQEWEAQNVVRFDQDKAAVEARVSENCALHPEWGSTPKAVLRSIYKLARPREATL